MFKIKALELAEDPSVYWKEGKKKNHSKAAIALEVLLSYVLVFFLCSGSVMVYNSVFPIDSSMHVVLLCIAIVEILLFFVYLLPALRRFAPILTACGFFLGFLFLREPIFSGLKQCANEVIRKFNAHFGAELSVFQNVEETVPKQTAVYFVVLLFLWWFVEVLFHLKNIPLLAIPPLVLVCGELLIGKSPEELPLVMVAGGFFVLLSFGNGRHIKAGNEISGLRVKAVLFLAAGIFLSLFLTDRFAREMAEKLVKMQDEVLSYQFAVESQIVELMPGGVWGQSPGRVSNRAPKYEEKEVLSVTTNKLPAENVYLRGYVGDTYRNGNWTNRSQMEFEDAMSQRLSYADKAEAGSYILNLLYKSQMSALLNNRSKYQIHYLDAKEDYAYLPYMTDLEHVSKDGRTVMPLLLEADAMVYREGAENLYLDGITPYNLFRDAVKSTDYVENKAIESSYSGYLLQYLRIPAGLSEVNRLGAELSKKLRLEYASVSGMGSLALTREIYAAYLVREELFERASYSLSLDRLPFGKDVVEYFLFESKKGFCEHYASAGVLLLRKMGIPARYVSGYVIRPEEFVAGSSMDRTADAGYTAVVKDSAAHAWVEVYIEHVGWIPVEMTEGMDDGRGIYEGYNISWETAGQPAGTLGNKEGNGLDAGWEEDSFQETEEEQESETQTPLTEESAETLGQSAEIQEKTSESSEAESMTSDKNSISAENPMEKEGNNNEKMPDNKGEAVILFGICALCICICGAIIIYCRRLKYKTKNSFRQKDYRKAIAEIVYSINRLLGKKGILRQRGLDDKGYREALKSGLLMVSEEDLYRYFSVLERVAYSNDVLEEEDVLCCYKIYKKIKEEISSKSGRTV